MNRTITISQLLFAVALIITAAVLFSFMKGCFAPPPAPIVTKTEKHDTQYIQQPTVTLPQIQPIIIRSDPASPVVIPAQYQNTSTDIKELTQQVKELAAQFYSVNHYKDSVQLRDSSGKRVGVVNLEQDVSENKIKALRPSYSLQFPVITNTYETIKTIPAANKNQVYFGAEIGGNQVKYLNDIGAGLIFKNKKEQLFKINGTIDIVGRLGARIGYYKKL